MEDKDKRELVSLFARWIVAPYIVLGGLLILILLFQWYVGGLIT